MYQLVALPLALLYSKNFAGNIYYKKERMKEWALAAIRFAAKSAHADGSCDEFFPNERSWGSTAILLADLTLAYRILNLKDAKLEEFFVRSARWIATHGEPVVKTNHISAAALALLHTYKITEDAEFFGESERLMERARASQADEGWFPESGGCDYGYTTINFDFMSRYYLQHDSDTLLESLKKAAKFLLPIVKRYKGFLPKTGSRGVDQFCVTGFALMRDIIPEAAEIERMWLKYNRQPQCWDDRYIVQEPSLFLVAMIGKEVFRCD